MSKRRILASTAAAAALSLCLASCGDGSRPRDDRPTFPKPTFSLAAGTYDGDQEVSITSAGGSVVHYTIDDPEVTPESAVYGGAIPIAGDGAARTIRAIACLNGYKDSPVAEASYTISYSWHAVGSAGFNGQGASRLDLALAPDGTPYVAYNSTPDPSTSSAGKLYLSRYSGGSWTAVGEALTSSGVICCRIAFDAGGTPYVAYATSNPIAAVVKRLDSGGSTWSEVGTASLPSLTGFVVALAFAPGGSDPYVFLGGATGKVLEFSGGSWQALGGASILPAGGFAGEVDLAVASGGTVYAAYTTPYSSGPASVKKFSGGAWSLVGSADFTPDDAVSISLALDPSGAPCLSFSDYKDNERYASMMRFDGSSWGFVGAEGFSPAQVYGTSLAFDPTDGAPIVGIIDGYAEATVMRYAGGSWSILGKESFSDPYDPDAYQISLAVDGSGRVYAAYQDLAAGSGVTVKRHLP
jgi:hypothetical protein